MKLCLITDNESFASAAERAGIDRIMLDLERKGKADRQEHLNLFLSDHQISSVPILAAALQQAALVVRINPLDGDSRQEIDEVVAGGADYVMLPYFHAADEVRQFIDYVDGRSHTVLLVETKAALEDLSEILDVEGIDEVHIGLNDLTLSLGRQSIFDLLCDGTIEGMANMITAREIPFGFGGIARLSHPDLPISPEHILAAQIRLKATRGWLGRSFRDKLESQENPAELEHEVHLLREAIRHWRTASADDLQESQSILSGQVEAWNTERCAVSNGV